MNNSQVKQNISSLMALMLFAVFACAILSVLLSGTQIYQRLTDRDQAAYVHRTTVQYLSTKIRQSDGAGIIRTEDFCGTDALVFTEEWEGETFQTRIYCYDGWLYELFSPENPDILPEDGEPLLPLRSLELELTGSLLHISIVEADETSTTFSLALRSTPEVLS